MKDTETTVTVRKLTREWDFKDTADEAYMLETNAGTIFILVETHQNHMHSLTARALGEFAPTEWATMQWRGPVE